MDRLVKWTILVVAAVVTLPILLFVAALRHSFKEAEQWGRDRLPWWDACNRLDVELTHAKYGHRVDLGDGRGWVKSECSQCGTPGFDVILRVNEGDQTLWCADCFRKHHVADFQPMPRTAHNWI